MTLAVYTLYTHWQSLSTPPHRGSWWWHSHTVHIHVFPWFRRMGLNKCKLKHCFPNYLAGKYTLLFQWRFVNGGGLNPPNPPSGYATAEQQPSRRESISRRGLLTEMSFNTFPVARSPHGKEVIDNFSVVMLCHECVSLVTSGTTELLDLEVCL